MDLRRDFPTPPEGAGAVPECILQAVDTIRKVRKGIETSRQYRDYAEYLFSFPSLNGSWQDLSLAIKQARKALRSVDHFAAFDEPAAGDAPGIDVTPAAKPVQDTGPATPRPA